MQQQPVSLRHHAVRLFGLAVLALAVAGCGTVDSLLRNMQSPIVRFEAWNRTLDPVTLTDADGKVLEIEACGHAVAELFNVEQVRIDTAAGYVSGFGSRGLAPTGEQFLVLVAAPGESFPTATAPASIPLCEGHPAAQPSGSLQP